MRALQFELVNHIFDFLFKRSFGSLMRRPENIGRHFAGLLSDGFQSFRFGRLQRSSVGDLLLGASDDLFLASLFLVIFLGAGNSSTDARPVASEQRYVEFLFQSKIIVFLPDICEIRFAVIEQRLLLFGLRLFFRRQLLRVMIVVAVIVAALLVFFAVISIVKIGVLVARVSIGAANIVAFVGLLVGTRVNFFARRVQQSLLFSVDFIVSAVVGRRIIFVFIRKFFLKQNTGNAFLTNSH